MNTNLAGLVVIAMLIIMYTIMFVMRYESIVSGRFINQRGGWVLIGGPIIIIALFSMIYVGHRISQWALVHGVIGVGRIDDFNLRQRNSRLDVEGNMYVYSGQRDFITSFKHHTVTNEWLSQISINDYVLLVIHPHEDRILDIYGPLVEEDEPLIITILEDKTLDQRREPAPHSQAS